MPPGSPVADCSSRAIAAAEQAVGVGGASGIGETLHEPADHRLLVFACVDVEQDQIGVDDRGGGAGHGITFVLVVGAVGATGSTCTASRSRSAGRGRADPGKAAAALP